MKKLGAVLLVAVLPFITSCDSLAASGKATGETVGTKLVTYFWATLQAHFLPSTDTTKQAIIGYIAFFLTLIWLTQVERIKGAVRWAGGKVLLLIVVFVILKTLGATFWSFTIGWRILVLIALIALHRLIWHYMKKWRERWKGEWKERFHKSLGEDSVAKITLAMGALGLTAFINCAWFNEKTNWFASPISAAIGLVVGIRWLLQRHRPRVLRKRERIPQGAVKCAHCGDSTPMNQFPKCIFCGNNWAPHGVKCAVCKETTPITDALCAFCGNPWLPQEFEPEPTDEETPPPAAQSPTPSAQPPPVAQSPPTTQPVSQPETAQSAPEVPEVDKLFPV